MSMGVERSCRAQSNRASTRRPTVIQARAELGPGHALYIRGRGPGLNWQKGTPLLQVDPLTWVWSNDRTKDTVRFQLLLDDLIWAKGEDQVLQPGQELELSPDFEWPEIPRTS